MKTLIIDTQTGEETIEDVSAERIKEWETTQEKIKEEAETLTKKAIDKAALLTKLGITEDEARLLLG